MAKNSFSQFPGRFAVLLEENIVKTPSPPKKPIEEARLKFELVLKKTHQDIYASHDSSEPEDLTVLCPSCNFQTTGSLKDHQKHHENNYGVQCPLCSYSASKEKDLNFHLINHHSRVNCVSEDETDEEPSSAPQKKYFYCSRCEYRSTRRSFLNSHILKKHLITSSPSSSRQENEEVLELCDECNFSTNDIAKMKFHQKCHRSNYRFKCRLCSFTYFYQNVVDKHVKNHHGNAKSPKRTRRSFKSRAEDHKRDPPKIKKKSLTKKNHHGNGAGFSSPEPGDADSTDDSELDSPPVKQRKYVADEDGDISLSKRVKRRHGNEETEEVSKCGECNFSTNFVAEMKFHQSCHSSNYRLKCPICSFSSFSKIKLTHHVKNHHENDANSPSSKKLKEAASISPKDDLVPDTPPIEPEGKMDEETLSGDEATLSGDEETLSCDEQLYRHGNETIPPPPGPEQADVSATPKDELLEPDSTLNNPSTLDAEEMSSSDQMVELPEALKSTDGLVPDPSPTEPRNLNEEEKNCHEQMAQLGTNSGNLDMEEMSCSDQMGQLQEVVTPADDLVLADPTPIEQRNLDEEEKCELQEAVTSTDGLVPDDQTPTEPKTLDEEEKSCLEQMVQLEDAVTPTDDLVSAEPTPIEPRNLGEEERSCHRLTQLEEAVTPTDDLVSAEPSLIEPRNLDAEEMSSSDQTAQLPDADTPADDLIPDLTPIEPRNLEVEERSCREKLAQLEKSLQSDGQSLENSSNQLMELEKKTQSLRKRVETAKKDERITEQMLKDLLLNKEEVEQQKKEAAIKKMKIEYELRVEQCKALELDLIEPDAVEEDHQERVASVQKKVRSLEEELGEIKEELAAMEEQEEAIAEDLVEAEECYVRAFRSRFAMVTELEELESSREADVNALNRLVDSSKERFEIYQQLEEQLLEIELEKTKEDLTKKRTNFLLRLKAEFDDFDDVY